MKIHASRKGSLAYSKRIAKSLVPQGHMDQAALWGNKVGITTVVQGGKTVPVTIIELATIVDNLVTARFKKPFSRCTTPLLPEQVVSKQVKVQSITKGKGFIGVVKMHGIKLGKRKRARANKERHVGCIAPRTGNTSYTSPHGGKKGPSTRTVLTTVVPYAVNLEAPYHRYGIIKNPVIVLKGSIPGNIKQIVKITLKN